MKDMRKIFSTLALFIVMGLFFPACGNGGNDTGKVNTLPSSAVSTERNTKAKPDPAKEKSAESKSTEGTPAETIAAPTLESPGISLWEIPEYSGSPYVAVNENMPFFRDEELVTVAFEYYSPQDSLGRCGTAYANVGKEIMPTKERGDIGAVRPTGWHTIKYDTIDGNYLYNRCHLIAYALAGENANEANLITGTRHLNIMGMGPFENRVADYVDETGNHVLYRVSPLFDGDNLLASGVLMEAKSVEDNGEGVLFNVFCYNIQPGIEIDYATGESRLADSGNIPADGLPAQTSSEAAAQTEPEKTPESSRAPELPPAAITYVLNTNTNKFHYPTCASAKRIAEHNRQEVSWSREECIASGYVPCKNCDP